jgi:hypothetical protein
MLPHNWGAYMVAVPDGQELSWHSHVAPSILTLFEQLGHEPGSAWVMDLLTGEGAWFSMQGDARAELEEHRIHASASFEGFLEWLYLQDLDKLWQLPHVIKVADTTFSINSYRRLGPHPVSFTLKKGDVIAIRWGGKLHHVTCDSVGEDGAVIRSLTPGERLELHLAGGPDDQEDAGDQDPAPGDEEDEDPRANGASVIRLVRAEDDETTIIPAVTDSTDELP